MFSEFSSGQGWLRFANVVKVQRHKKTWHILRLWRKSFGEISCKIENKYIYTIDHYCKFTLIRKYGYNLNTSEIFTSARVR